MVGRLEGSGEYSSGSIPGLSSGASSTLAKADEAVSFIGSNDVKAPEIKKEDVPKGVKVGAAVGAGVGAVAGGVLIGAKLSAIAAGTATAGALIAATGPVGAEPVSNFWTVFG